MRRRPSRGRAVALLLALLTALSALATGVAGADPGAPALALAPVTLATAPVRCALPTTGNPTTARPDQVDLDAAALDRAIAFASSRLRVNVQVYRNNCLVGTAPQNAVTGNLPWQEWSVTKSVVSMLAGVAVTQGRLRLDDPIGAYLEPGRGDAAHRAITVRQLLTETAGLQQSIVSEGLTALLDVDPNIVDQGLAAPVQHPAGTYFEYAQHVPDLLAHVVERAVGADLQAFAQQELFGPVGIAAQDYYWARDRSGNTYGYAFLYLPPNDLARLGLLMLNDGAWNGDRIISADYVHQASAPSPANPCYGFLFWTNNAPCTGPSIPSRQTVDVAPLAGLPPDAYAMVGFLQQNAFIVPSLGLLVTWNGVLGDVSPDLSTVISANIVSELYHDFFRALGPAFLDVRLPDAGAYVPSFNTTVDPAQFASLAVLLGPFGIGPNAAPGCTVLACGSAPLRAPGTAAPPGCVVIACLPLGPTTPRRVDPGPGPVA